MSPLPQFQQLAERHRTELQVTWYTFETREGQLMLMAFRRLGKVKGQGRVALAEVCALADQLGVVLQLGTSVPKLFEYYEAFGFKIAQQLDYARFYRRKPQAG